mmetsp:Transcript_38404/g.90835  ORF Transcript_38404/g.90835 Transcript_38404/m.90835 type:complete len:301 (-) Transcript_38404:464-1366(-)
MNLCSSSSALGVPAGGGALSCSESTATPTRRDDCASCLSLAESSCTVVLRASRGLMPSFPRVTSITSCTMLFVTLLISYSPPIGRHACATMVSTAIFPESVTPTIPPPSLSAAGLAPPRISDIISPRFMREPIAGGAAGESDPNTAGSFCAAAREGAARPPILAQPGSPKSSPSISSLSLPDAAQRGSPSMITTGVSSFEAPPTTSRHAFWSPPIPTGSSAPPVPPTFHGRIVTPGRAAAITEIALKFSNSSGDPSSPDPMTPAPRHPMTCFTPSSFFSIATASSSSVGEAGDAPPRDSE